MANGSKIALLLALMGGLLTACVAPGSPPVETVVVTSPPEVVTATPTPAPTTAELVICQEGEPETLYLYASSAAARHVLEAIYDGPIDHRNYAFQPVILDGLPSLEEGDAYFDPIVVQEGDRVVDVNGRVVELTAGVQVLPRHTCVDLANPDCVATFDGTPIEMERMVVSWQLLDGVTWSDGEPVTADDSVYSYEVACDPDTPTSAATAFVKDLCERTASYAAAGTATVVWTGLPGYVDDLYFLNFFSPLPRHLWQRTLHATPADLLTRVESTRQPLGWGPFVITEWEEGDHITLERNPHYFRAGEGLPHLDRVTVRFARDIYQLTSMLVDGQCDVGLLRDGQMGGSGPSYERLSEVMPFLIAAQEQGLLTLAVAPSEAWEHLEFGVVPVSTYNRPDFFGDVRVRQAIAQCVDRQALVDEATMGLGRIADSYVLPDHPLFAGDRLTRWPYDPQAGRALLAEVGWVDENGDGVLEAQNVTGVRRGTPFQVRLTLAAEERQREAIARIIRANLLDCGIDVDLEFLPWDEFWRDGPEGPVMGRQFDLVLSHWLNGVEPPCALYLTEEIPGPDNWTQRNFNIAGFSLDTYDGTCRAALAALPGSQEYTQNHLAAQEIFSQQLPDLPLFWWVRVAMTRPGMANFTLDPSEESELWGIESLDVPR